MQCPLSAENDIVRLLYYAGPAPTGMVAAARANKTGKRLINYLITGTKEMDEQLATLSAFPMTVINFHKGMGQSITLYFTW